MLFFCCVFAHAPCALPPPPSAQPVLDCSMPVKVEYFIIGKSEEEKGDIEVRRSIALNEAVSLARAELKEALAGLPDGVSPAPLSLLLLDPLTPLTARKVASLQPTDRGNARQLCAQVRVFAEAAGELLRRANVEPRDAFASPTSCARRPCGRCTRQCSTLSRASTQSCPSMWIWAMPASSTSSAETMWHAHRRALPSSCAVWSRSC